MTIIRTFLVFLFISLLGTVLAQTKTIHVLVALCDNKNQGIVPVPAKIGNGQDPQNNLYWGCAYGMKTFFKKLDNWTLIKKIDNPDSMIYERLIFKHRDSSIFLITDAYDGYEIKQTVYDFLHYAAGNHKEVVMIDRDTINTGGDSELICYVGHNGLMDFELEDYPQKSDTIEREVIILACDSKSYFSEPLRLTGAYPLLWTTNLMCPEVYTLDRAINHWIKGASGLDIKEHAAKAYNEYQKCGMNGARKLFVTGWSDE